MRPRHAGPAPIQVAVTQSQTPTSTSARAGALVSAVTVADIGFNNGIRFANLGARREVFVPLPQSADIRPSELVLALDDVSAYEARRSIEILVNDRSVAAIALDGRSMGRIVRIPLVNALPRDGFLKLGFLYSGAATQDRCIDVRYVGDSVTVRPESAVEIEILLAPTPDVATVAALMPREVAVIVPDRGLGASGIAAALTVARALIISGRHVSFYQGPDSLPALAQRSERRRWHRGLIFVGAVEDIVSRLEGPLAKVAGALAGLGTLAIGRNGGLPVLIVSDAIAAPAARLFASSSLAATRGLPTAAVAEVVAPNLPADRVSFERLGIVPPQAEVFGRADLAVTIPTRLFPAATKPSRLVLDVMVAPDGAGERAVVSAFLNERLLGSTVAAIGEPTRLDLSLAEGLFGAAGNIRAVVQRRSAQGDCRFEPQGYPAQILGSSSVVLTNADAPHDFYDLATGWTNGVELLLPESAAAAPLPFLGLLGEILGALSPENAPISVKLVTAGKAPAPTLPFIAIGDTPPAGGSPRVRFDRGRVAVADRSGRVMLDLGGFSEGAVAQIVVPGDVAGLWIRPLASDGGLPAPSELRLDRGDVAFLDKAGVALAMSTERDKLLSITYPDQVSWITVAERFRSWLIGGLWLLASAVFLLVLQRRFRQKPQTTGE